MEDAIIAAASAYNPVDGPRNPLLWMLASYDVGMAAMHGMRLKQGVTMADVARAINVAVAEAVDELLERGG
jgi:hypothetical protein